MEQASRVGIIYFSDLLCIWAYAAQARVDEVKARFGAEVAFDYRFCGIFGDTAERIGEGWKAKGGYAGFNAHIRDVADRFDHIEVDPEIWLTVRPASSASAHLFLKAVVLTEAETTAPAESALERAAWALRLAFFRDGRDIATRAAQTDVARELGLPVDAIQQSIDSGAAHAALCGDGALEQKLSIEGSPTFVLNEGRQKLYGNVGYRVIEANLQELLRAPDLSEASWC
jgi:predicted DsbA family dithiol-disulfide isomerase